jgi:cation transport protein ChaC
MTTEMGDLWVFGYGSLMWRPGFAFTERVKATLPGYVRRFCLDSITYRGTPNYPGLVLALDAAAGQSCGGVAFRVPAAERAATHQYLRDRELDTYAYVERFLPLSLDTGQTVSALCYVMDQTNQQYRGGLNLAQQAEVIATARGPAGTNVEYLEKTVDQLGALGIDDPEMLEVRDLVATFLQRKSA